MANIKGMWVSPEQAVIAEQETFEDAYAADDKSEQVFDMKEPAAPTTDTISAENVKNMYTFVEEKPQAKEETVQIYANNSYTGDGYEDLTVPTFSVAKSAKFDEPVKTPAFESVAPARSVVTESKPAANSIFNGFVNTSFLFDTKPSVRSEAVKIETPTTVEPVKSEPVNAEPVKRPQVRTSVGFNTATASASTSGYTPSKLATGSRSISADKFSVQVLRPTNVEDVNEACTLLKDGNVVMTVLSGISDRNARLRYLDYLSGCCKGCDADFREIVKVDSIDAVLIAAPKGIGLKFPIPQAAAAAAYAEAAEEPEQKPASSSTQGAFNVFGATNKFENKATENNEVSGNFDKFEIKF